MVVEYVRALMQKKLVCRNSEERRQMAQQMLQDDQRLREVFHSLVRISIHYINQIIFYLFLSKIHWVFFANENGCSQKICMI